MKFIISQNLVSTNLGPVNRSSPVAASILGYLEKTYWSVGETLPHEIFGLKLVHVTRQMLLKLVKIRMNNN